MTANACQIGSDEAGAAQARKIYQARHDVRHQKITEPILIRCAHEQGFVRY
jgi:hypothetical protein